MKHTLICFVVLFFAAFARDAQSTQQEAPNQNARPVTVELTLHSAKALEPRHKYLLLPKPEQQSNSDAFPIYEEATQSLQDDFQTKEISQWLSTPFSRLPRKEVQSTLQRFESALQLIEQTTKCERCDWPDVGDDTLTENLRKYRRLAFLVALQARFQIGQGQYDKAVTTMRTGFVLTRHLGKGPTLIHGLVGVAVGALMCRQLEHFVQGPDAPNLYWALQSLPRPLVDLTEQTVLETPEIRERVHLLMNRLGRHVAALQCIEAIRLYAAAQDGRCPDELSNVGEVSVPHDPVTQKPFVYHRTGAKCVLEGPAPKGAAAKEAIRYELTLKE